LIFVTSPGESPGAVVGVGVVGGVVAGVGALVGVEALVVEVDDCIGTVVGEPDPIIRVAPPQADNVRATAMRPALARVRRYLMTLLPLLSVACPHFVPQGCWKFDPIVIDS
jgi:hypothetical protein